MKSNFYYQLKIVLNHLNIFWYRLIFSIFFFLWWHGNPQTQVIVGTVDEFCEGCVFVGCSFVEFSNWIRTTKNVMDAAAIWNQSIIAIVCLVGFVQLLILFLPSSIVGIQSQRNHLLRLKSVLAIFGRRIHGSDHLSLHFYYPAWFDANHCPRIGSIQNRNFNKLFNEFLVERTA